MRRSLLGLSLVLSICMLLAVMPAAQAAEPDPYDGSYTITVPEQTVGPSNCRNIKEDIFTMQVAGATVSLSSPDGKVPGTVTANAVAVPSIGMRGQFTVSGSGVKVAGAIDLGDPDCPFRFTGVRTSVPAGKDTSTQDGDATSDQTATDEAATTEQTPTTNQADKDDSGGISSTALLIAVILILAALGVGVFFVRPGR